MFIMYLNVYIYKVFKYYCLLHYMVSRRIDTTRCSGEMPTPGCWVYTIMCSGEMPTP